MFSITYPGYSDRGAPGNDTYSEEEEELQEAIQRSLSHDQTTPTPSAPPPLHDHDEDTRVVQQHTNANPPPPYNPVYNPQELGASQRAATSDIFEAETVIVGDSEQDQGAELRRRRLTETGSASGSRPATHRETRERQQSRTHNDMDSVRAARLRRFGGMT